MKTLQLIDSLRIGGAEKMALSYANALSKRIDASYLCCTRKEGLLKKQLLSEVHFLFLEKRMILDLRAFLMLRKFVKENHISIVQAHSSSWFLAVLLKVSLPQIHVVWHDHYGKRLEKRKIGLLNLGSFFFDGIISVNQDLYYWAYSRLRCKKIRLVPNFLQDKEMTCEMEKGFLSDFSEERFNIICTANLRPQKDHLNLIKAFIIFSRNKKGVRLHLAGKDWNDEYSREIQDFIKCHSLEEKVILLGEVQGICSYLSYFDIGVLSSVSEGLPVSVLEYGRAGLPVICTEVGECKEVIGEDGILVPPRNPEKFAEAMELYFENQPLRKDCATRLQKKIMDRYSEEAIVPAVISFFKELVTSR